MSEIAIRAEGISKKYRLGVGGGDKVGGYQTFREFVTSTLGAPFRHLGKLAQGQTNESTSLEDTFWALQDVSFEIKKGQSVGIIGRNGAGKSTLLKILSRITEPTSGFAEIHGRVASLLEVGTGFHGELTGRENIFLNGAILGMPKAEIRRKFDEIVAFAEVERFVDTPVKHYSTGMYMRLAFAVAAHLEPDILIVDEVLAVGDSRFQRKCLNKMEDVGEQGRTVLFVSHNMPAVTRLCPRSILLHDGKLVREGPSHEVVGGYLNPGLHSTALREWNDPATAPGGHIARLRAARVKTETEGITNFVDVRESIAIEVEWDALLPGYVIMPSFHVYNEDGVHIFTSNDLDPKWRRQPRPVGRYISTGWIPGDLLSEGSVFVTLENTTLDPPIRQFHEPNAVAFQIVDRTEGDSARGDWVGKMKGIVRPKLEWSTIFSPEETSIGVGAEELKSSGR